MGLVIDFIFTKKLSQTLNLKFLMFAVNTFQELFFLSNETKNLSRILIEIESLLSGGEKCFNKRLYV